MRRCLDRTQAAIYSSQRDSRRASEILKGWVEGGSCAGSPKLRANAVSRPFMMIIPPQFAKARRARAGEIRAVLADGLRWHPMKYINRKRGAGISLDGRAPHCGFAM